MNSKQFFVHNSRTVRVRAKIKSPMALTGKTQHPVTVSELNFQYKGKIGFSLQISYKVNFSRKFADAYHTVKTFFEARHYSELQKRFETVRLL